MHMRIERIIISLLLIGGTANAFAEPGEHQRGMRAYSAHEAMQEPGPPQAERPQEEQVRTPPRGFVLPDTSGYAALSDNGERPTRLTAEERRLLRQQINEAGRDPYYSPRHR